MLEDPYGYEDAKLERCYWRRVGLFLFCALLVGLIVGLLLLPREARADEVFKNRNAQEPVSLRLKQEPCTNAAVVTALASRGIFGEVLGRFKAAVLTYGGKDWASCWTPYNGYVLSVDEEGSELQPIPRNLFREDTI